MHGRSAIFVGVILGVIVAFTYNPVRAVIKAETPLKAIEASATYIFVGKVEKHFPDKPAMLVTITEDIKGKAAFRALPINCKIADEKVVKENQIEPLLKRFGPEIDIIFFVNAPAAGRKNLITFAFTNGTWFQILGTPTGEKDQFVFSLKSAEPYFRKSFKGSTEELRKLLKDHAAGKVTLPALDDKVQPGFGPEYAPKKGAAHPQESLRSSWGLALFNGAPMHGGGSLFAVIPTVGIGAPLAILALLFPTVFGGVFVLFRQWMAFITVISINSTLILLHWWLAPIFLRGSWWSTDASLWFLMTAATLVCTIWAWRRQLNFLASGEAEAPQRTEQMTLLIMSASFMVTCALMWYFARPSWGEVSWALTVVMTIGILVGTICKFSGHITSDSVFAAPAMATEGIILGAMLLGHLVFVPAIWGTGISTEGTAEGNGQAGITSAKVAPVVKKWDFIVDAKGMYASSPVVDGDYLYAAYSETVTRVATLVKLDRNTGVKKWDFVGKNEDLVQLISTPCLAGGKLYIGEGFHDDKNCKVYCIDAESGQEVWRFQTGGQTESSPAVANGKVYVGAGNEGVYCLDAKTGAKVWRYPHDESTAVTRAAYKVRIQRFGGGMRVIGNRLYCGTGVDRNQKDDKGETAAFCFDADTGKLLWKTPVPYPVWSTPVVKDGFVYITTGNGDVFDDAQPPDVPGGSILCLDAETGAEKWRFNVVNGIIEAPAVDAHRIYFGCRDGQIYCLGRADGKERWRRFLESPIIGTPALDCDPVYERTVSVFAAAAAGKVCCLNPQTGDIVWTYDLTQQLAYISTSPRLVVTRTPDGYRRQLYFGAGIGGGTRDVTSNRPVFYCLEDMVKVD